MCIYTNQHPRVKDEVKKRLALSSGKTTAITDLAPGKRSCGLWPSGAPENLSTEATPTMGVRSFSVMKDFTSSVKSLSVFNTLPSDGETLLLLITVHRRMHLTPSLYKSSQRCGLRGLLETIYLRVFLRAPEPASPEQKSGPTDWRVS